MTLRIDFHIHTVPNLEKDNPFLFDKNWMKKYLIETGLDAVAITNHNLFDKKNYEEVRSSVQELDNLINIFPGMELDIEGGHSLIIYDNTVPMIEELSEASARLKSQNLGSNRYITINQLKEFFPSWNRALFVYESGKANSIPNFWPGLEGAVHAAGINKPGMFFRREAINSSDASLLFSDAHATFSDGRKGNISPRNDISKLRNKNSFISTDSNNFNSIKKAIDERKVGLTKDLLPDKFTITVNQHDVEFSSGLNLLIGERGTGKSYLLDKFSEQSDEKQNIAYLKQFQTAINADKNLSQLTNKHALEQQKKWLQSKEDYFNNIKNFFQNEEPDDNIDRYLKRLFDYGEKVAASRSASNIRLLTGIKINIPSLDWLKKGIKSIELVGKDQRIWKIESVLEYKQEIRDFHKKLVLHFYDLEWQNKRNEFINEILNDVTSAVKRETGVAQSPEFDLISRFRYEETRSQINRTTKTIIKHQTLETVEIAGYKLVSTFSPITGAEDFRKYHSLPRDISVKENLIDPYTVGKFDVFFNALANYEFVKPTQSFGEFVGFIRTELRTNNGAKASGGQAAGFVLMDNLERGKKANVILLDEPEISLDSKFIKEQLVPSIQNLAENHIVVVATHNSNVGSLLMPNQILVTKYDSNLDEYLVGYGDYTSGKINVNGNSTLFADDFIAAMEAGYDQYKKKGEEYENIRAFR